jgi:hypothetical protein
MTDKQRTGWGLTVVPIYFTVSNITIAIDILSISLTKRSYGIGWRGKSRSLFALYYDVDTSYLGDKRSLYLELFFIHFNTVWKRTFKPKIYPCDVCHQPVLEKEYNDNAGRCKDCAIDWKFNIKR